MFDLVRNNKKFIQIVLALIMLPFALWGVDSYVRTGSSEGVATVGGTPIVAGEFQQALQEQQNRLRAQLGDQANLAALESPELRRGVLDELINQHLLRLYVTESQLTVNDEALVNFITSVPSLQENGKFSRERYQALVAAQGMSVEMFEARVKRDLVMQQAMIAVGNAAVSGRVPADRWLAAQLEEREVSEALLDATQFAKESRPDQAAIKRYYEENRKRFEKPEQVRVEYLILSQAKLTENAKVGDVEVSDWYKSNEARYKQAEQRQASHILLRLDKDSSESDVKAVQAKAEQIHAQLRANLADFGKLAKQFSQDPGSAEKGGDLGYFGRGMMVKPFEDAVYSLKENQLSDIVRSDFGFHIIKLTGVRPEQVRPLAAVRDEILAELKRQAGAKQYAEAAEGFSNTVYEQSDSLKPAADKFGLAVRNSEWITQGGQGEAPFTHPKLLQSIFSDDALKNKRNSEAVDIGGNILVSTRVIEHRPASLEPLEAVAGVIEQALVREAAVTKAATVGRTYLDKLTKGEKVTLTWSAARSVSRLQATNLPAEARNAIFSLPTKTLPAYTGMKVAGGFALYRINAVKPYDGTNGSDAASRGQPLRQHYGQVVAQEDLVGWLAVLRQRYPVTINAAMLERKQ